MSQVMISELVNIDVMPSRDANTDLITEVTAGDLHANAVKLLYILVRHGFARIKNDDYTIFAGLYRKSVANITEAEYKQLESIIESIEVIRPELLLRLIGDETADRGKCDIYTLLILDKLKRSNQRMEIIFSNHGADFIYGYEHFAEGDRLKKFMLESLHAQSMIGANTLLERKLISKEKLFQLIDDSYKPYLKLLSYTYEPDERRLSIYSHAAIDFSSIALLAEKFEVESDLSSVAHLLSTIDRINDAYQKLVLKNKLSSIYDVNSMQQGYFGGGLYSGKSNNKDVVLSRCAWNRNYTDLKRQKAFYPQFSELKVLNWFHGHDSDDPMQKIWGLDNDCGKIPYNEFHNGRRYKALLSKKNPKKTLQAGNSKSEKTALTTTEKAKTIKDGTVNKQNQESITPLKAKYDALSLPLLMKLAELETKGKTNTRYQTVGLAAAELKEKLKNNAEQYFQKKIITPVMFKKNCLDILKNLDKTEFGKHRGLLEFIHQFVIKVGNLMAKPFTKNGQFFKMPKTKSLQAIETFEIRVSSLEPLSKGIQNG